MLKWLQHKSYNQLDRHMDFIEGFCLFCVWGSGLECWVGGFLVGWLLFCCWFFCLFGVCWALIIFFKIHFHSVGIFCFLTFVPDFSLSFQIVKEISIPRVTCEHQKRKREQALSLQTFCPVSCLLSHLVSSSRSKRQMYQFEWLEKQRTPQPTA